MRTDWIRTGQKFRLWCIEHPDKILSRSKKFRFSSSLFSSDLVPYFYHRIQTLSTFPANLLHFFRRLCFVRSTFSITREWCRSVTHRDEPASLTRFWMEADTDTCRTHSPITLRRQQSSLSCFIVRILDLNNSFSLPFSTEDELCVVWDTIITI